MRSTEQSVGMIQKHLIIKRYITMAIDKVREYFKTYQMDDHILEFEVSSATVELAAEALHCEGKRMSVCN